MASPVHIFNTLTRKKEEFKPIHSGRMGFYSCGPTVYHFAHIGNLRSYVFADVLKRTFKLLGYNVQHVMNITDVGHLTSDSDTGEDKMEKGAAREKKSVWQIAEFYTEAFMRDMRLLNILPPDEMPKATDHIKEQVAQIQEIEKNGYAYTIGDGVYFDTAKLPNYGKLIGATLEGLKAGARIELVDGKRHPADFALWKFSKPNEKRQMEWNSPWGRGFPGWHIECSAMSVKYLGSRFDIHTGGIDHIPVHHTNEIAQAEAAHIPFANYWMHGEFLVLKDNEKMAKSGDNFLTLSSLIERGYDALDYRYLCLTAHYRKQLMFSWEALTTAQQAHMSLKNKVLHYRESTHNNDRNKDMYRSQFLAAIADDINMPQALAVLYDMLGDEVLGGKQKYELALLFDSVLGLDLQNIGEETIPDEVLELVKEREEKRKAKQWQESDRIREKIAALGFEVRDTPEGPVVRPK